MKKKYLHSFKYQILLAFIICFISSCKKEETQTPAKSPIITNPPTTYSNSVGIYYEVSLFVTRTHPFDYKQDTTNVRMYLKKTNGNIIPIYQHYTQYDTNDLQLMTNYCYNCDTSLAFPTHPIYPVMMAHGDSLVLEIDSAEFSSQMNINSGYIFNVDSIFTTPYGFHPTTQISHTVHQSSYINYFARPLGFAPIFENADQSLIWWYLTPKLRIVYGLP